MFIVGIEDRQKHTYRQTGIGWEVHSDGDIPAACILSTFIIYCCVRRLIYRIQLMEEKGAGKIANLYSFRFAGRRKLWWIVCAHTDFS